MTASEIVGVDFGPAADLSPTNWTSTDGNGGVTYTLQNLPDELGGATPIDLTVQLYDTFGDFGSGSIAPTAADPNVPTHTNSLTNIDGALIVTGSAITNFVDLRFDDLTAGGSYEIYLFGGDPATTSSQDVQIFDSSINTFFTQSWTNNQFVNGLPASTAPLGSFAVTGRGQLVW